MLYSGDTKLRRDTLGQYLLFMIDAELVLLSGLERAF